MFTSIHSRSSILMLSATLLAGSAAAQVTQWESLPREPHKLLYSLDDYRGKRILLGENETEAYVNSIGFMRYPDGGVVVSQFDLILESGPAVKQFDPAEHPQLASPITTLDELFGSDHIVFTDDLGVVWARPMNSLDPTIDYDPGQLGYGLPGQCGMTGGISTCQGWCNCGPPPHCWCNAPRPQPHFSCQLKVAAQECGGRCGGERVCADDRGPGAGCGCQN